jgi:hypothetical protein
MGKRLGYVLGTGSIPEPDAWHQSGRDSAAGDTHSQIQARAWVVPVRDLFKHRDLDYSQSFAGVG